MEVVHRQKYPWMWSQKTVASHFWVCSSMDPHQMIDALYLRLFSAFLWWMLCLLKAFQTERNTRLSWRYFMFVSGGLLLRELKLFGRCTCVFKEFTRWAKTLTIIGVRETLKSVGELKVLYFMAYWRQRLWLSFLCPLVALSIGRFGMFWNKQSGWYCNHWCWCHLAGCHQKILVIDERYKVVWSPAPTLLSRGVVWFLGVKRSDI